MKKVIAALAVATILVIVAAIPTLADAHDVDLEGSGSYVRVELSSLSWDMGVLPTGYSGNISSPLFTVSNYSSIATDAMFQMGNESWEGTGVAWAHSETGIPAADTVGLYVKSGSTESAIPAKSPVWGKANATPFEDWSFNLLVRPPSTVSDGHTKHNALTITVVAH